MKADNSNDLLLTESLKSADFELSDFTTALKVGFDGKRAARNYTGLGNYSRYVIEIMATYFSGNEYVVYSPGELDDQRGSNIKDLPGVQFHYPKKSIFKSFWRSLGIIGDLKKDRIDLYHGLSNEIPFGVKKSGIPCVVTVHDLIFLRYPHYYPWFDRQVYRIKFEYACRYADKIIAISEQTKRDIIEYFDIPESRIEVIYQNCSSNFEKRFTPDELVRIKEIYRLPDKYILNVGTIESRKNLMAIAKALNEVQSDTHLVVVGRETAYARKVKSYIQEKNLSHRVLFLKNVPADDLPGIYRLAKAFVFPSEFEGFGIPILESLHSGVPVIAASGSCLEEAGGPESIYLRPDDASGFASAINLVLNDPVKKQKMIDAGFDYVKKFSDRLIAEQLMELYQRVKSHA